MSTTSLSGTKSVEHPTIDQEMPLRIGEQLGARFKGDLIGPGHVEYNQARLVWNAMIDRRPGLILRCTSTEDVVDAATAPHGLIVPAGIMSETGVAGLALGGGIGWFSRKHGLTCDQFVSLELVLASGEVIEVSADEHPELFWALKGGGGNFGVVTRFTFRAHRFGPMIRVGVSLYEPEDAAQALHEYASISPTLPRTVGWHAALKHDMPALPFVPPELVGRRLLMLISMWLDDAEDPAGAELVERPNAVGRPCTQATTVMPFAAALQKVLDEEFADGHRYYTKEAHVE